MSAEKSDAVVRVETGGSSPGARVCGPAGAAPSVREATRVNARRRPKTPSRRGPASSRSALAYRSLRPLLRILIASGLTAGELKAMLRRALREHRKESVHGEWQESAFENLLGAAAAIASTWRQGVRWLDEHGEPRTLTLTRAGTGSFAELVKEASPAADPRAALADLERTGTAVRQPKNAIRLVGRAIVFTNPDHFDAVGILTHLRRFLEMLEHNVFELDDPADGYLERAAHAANLDPARFAEFNRYFHRQLEAFVLAGDATLRKYEVKEPGAPTGAYGFGVYVFRDADPAAKPVRRTRRRQR